jgi:hypothetical protein
VTERFEHTLVLIQASLGWATPWYTDANVTRGRPRIEQLDRGAVAVIEERNVYDRALHQLAQQRLEEGIADLGPRHEVLLRRLRRHNRWMSHVGRVRTLISNVRRSDPS